MQLSDEVKAALERARLGAEAYDDYTSFYKDFDVIKDAMLDLFPPGYFDPITPERLAEVGFSSQSIELGAWQIDCRNGVFIDWHESADRWLIGTEGLSYEGIPLYAQPRNVGEVLELVARCKEWT